MTITHDDLKKMSADDIHDLFINGKLDHLLGTTTTTTDTTHDDESNDDANDATNDQPKLTRQQLKGMDAQSIHDAFHAGRIALDSEQ